MQLFIEETYEDMSRRAADLIAAQLRAWPPAPRPSGLYADLVEDFQADRISFEQVTTFNLDEYRGLPKEHPESYRSFMHKNLFDHVDIDPEAKINLPDGTNPDARSLRPVLREAIGVGWHRPAAAGHRATTATSASTSRATSFPCAPMWSS